MKSAGVGDKKKYFKIQMNEKTKYSDMCVCLCGGLLNQLYLSIINYYVN